MPAGADVMAPPRDKGKKSTPPPDERVVIVHLKGSTQYAEFLERLHRKTHIPKASMFRLAFELWCKQNGHEAPPEF